MVAIDEVICAPPPPGVLFSAREAFGTDEPFELEIGCGKGGFLLERGRARPEVHLLGIEWANKYFKYAADRMARWGLTNVRVMRTDAGHFVRHHLPPACLSALHVFHPDPWPKKRHHKRRLIQPEFVAAVCAALVPGGRWALQTDHLEYYEWMMERIASAPQLEQVDFVDPEFGIEGECAETNFRIKYRSEGRDIYRIAFRKRGGSRP